jgi:hypothetical protein
MFLIALPAQAAMIGTAQMQSPTNAMVDAQAITQQRNWIRHQLEIGGVSKPNAWSRVAAMTDSQVQQIHQRIDQAPAGGSTLIIVILLLVITELLGYTDIIPDK